MFKPRFLILLWALLPPAAAIPAGAAEEDAAQSPNSPPVLNDDAPAFRGPDVTLIEGEDRKIYEYRLNGQLRMIKIVPSFGKPYYLVPKDPSMGWDDLERADGLVPQWTILRF